VPQLSDWGGKLKEIPLIGSGIGQCLTTWGHSPKLRRIGDFLQQPISLAAAYQSYRGVFTHTETQIIARQYLSETPARVSPHIPLESNCKTPADEVSYLELTCYMRNQLLRDSDVMSMNWGLELRTPLVDRTLLETVSSIPSQIRLAAGKQLLIESIPELPDWVVNRPKQGFAFPLDLWMSGPFGDYFQDISVPDSISLKPWSRRWSLVILEHWWDQVKS
jgi:asparagine synthase (glutamine-hydrolysing)